MQRATKSEKFLLSILGLVILAGLIFFGSKMLNQRQRIADLERATLRADNAEATVELQDELRWQKRAQWIRDHEPIMGEEGDARAQMQSFLVKGARDFHLEVQDRNLGAVRHNVAGVKIQSEMRVKGTMEDICRWLANLQKPESFYAVDLFSLKADQDEKSMVCSLNISRYFQEPSK